MSTRIREIGPRQPLPNGNGNGNGNVLATRFPANREHYKPEDRVLTLPALRLVQPPRRSRRLSKLLFWLFLLSPFALAFVPWRQYVGGGGTVLAFDPVDRPQEIDAPISGRIKNWYVVEGSRLKEGDPIMEIVDNDPEFLPRLRNLQEAERTKLEANEQRMELVKLEIQLLQQARDLAIEAATNHLEMARAKVNQAKAAIVEAEASKLRNTYNFTRQRQLQKDGLSAVQEVEIAEMGYKQALASVDSANAALVSANEEVEAYQADLERIKPAEDAKIQKAEGDLRSAIGMVESNRQAVTGYETQINRQLTQVVNAPRDGVILRILANKTLNGQVAAGEPLVMLVPEVEDRVAEIFVDGNDAPLIQPGDPVRLKFEGWPAVQFVGWPSVAVGSFGGEVLLVDATSNASGQFRILVKPAQFPGDEPWPSPRYLRQGVRAKAFVLLQQVTMGWEVWRRLNGFPPVIAQGEPGTPPKMPVKRPKS